MEIFGKTLCKMYQERMLLSWWLNYNTASAAVDAATDKVTTDRDTAAETEERVATLRQPACAPGTRSPLGRSTLRNILFYEWRTQTGRQSRIFKRTLHGYTHTCCLRRTNVQHDKNCLARYRTVWAVVMVKIPNLYTI